MKISATLFLLFLGLSLSAQVFMQPFDNAANLASGGATVAWDAPVNGFTNPAQLGKAPQVGVFAWSAIPYSIKGWQSHGFQAMSRIQKRSGVGLEILHSGVEGYAEQRFQLSYGRQLSEKVSLGGSVQGMRVSADEYGSANAVTFAVGITARPLPRVLIGAIIQNPAPQKISGQTISNLIRIGTQWRPSEIFAVSAEVSKDIARPVQIKAGMEYRPIDLLYLRAGMRTSPARTAFGAGLALKNGIRIDFGSEWHSVLGFTPAAMIAWNKF